MAASAAELAFKPRVGARVAQESEALQEVLDRLDVDLVMEEV